MKHQQYDIIIAGAGASGLILLNELLKSTLSDRRILLLDRSFSEDIRKTWSFWSRGTPHFPDLYHRWSRLSVQSFGQEIREDLLSFRYYSVESDIYRERVLRTAGRFPNTTLLEADIEHFPEPSTGGPGTVTTSSGSYHADWVFQSIQKPPHWNKARVSNRLIQHFTGWRVQTHTDRFDPDEVVLMDMDIPQRDGLTFFYLLPYSEREALVEYTLFSKQPFHRSVYEEEIRSYLSRRYGLFNNDYRVEKSEYGEIPMEDRSIDNQFNSRTFSIGEAGGLTKPTTGYTFSRMSSYAKQVVKCLEKGGRPPTWSGSSYRFRIYDILLLNLLCSEPDAGRNVFHRLFSENSMETVLTFLNEETHLSEELQIFSKMPYGPFFRSIARMSPRILSGA